MVAESLNSFGVSLSSVLTLIAVALLSNARLISSLN